MRLPGKVLGAALAGLGMAVMVPLPLPSSWASKAVTALHASLSRPAAGSPGGRIRQAGPAFRLDRLWQEIRRNFPAVKGGKLVVVDVHRQKLFLLDHGRIAHRWPVSTSIDGTDQEASSDGTPLGVFKIARKLGTGLPPNEILHDRSPTGHLAVPVHASDRPAASRVITTRILWLAGLQPGWNKGGDVDTYRRHIYIHGTANLGMLGHPASRGCVQMAPRAVITLYRDVKVGTPVAIVSRLGHLAAALG